MPQWPLCVLLLNTTTVSLGHSAAVTQLPLSSPTTLGYTSVKEVAREATVNASVQEEGDLTRMSGEELREKRRRTEEELRSICLLKKNERTSLDGHLSEEEIFALRHRLDPEEARLLWRLVQIEGLMETRMR